MKRTFFLLLCLSVLLVCVAARDTQPKNEWRLMQLFNKMFSISDHSNAQNGGAACAAYTVAIAFIEQLSQVHQSSTNQVMQKICTWLPAQFAAECDLLVDTFGPVITVMLANKETPDAVCDEIRVCQNSTCRLFPPPTEERPRAYEVPKFPRNFERPSFLPTWNWPWDQIADHKPVFDADGDLFSTSATLRGYNWRGADCADGDNSIYPGRRFNNYNGSVDHDCNGIYGYDSQDRAYEDLLCKGTKRMGVVVLGDSASAHFHIPPEWVTPALMNATVFANMMSIAENELDWPMMSSATGYMNSTWAGHPDGYVDSGYLRMWQRNHCIQRDYQNIAVNGARSGAMRNTIIKSFARNQTLDHPVFLSYALIGNDVCNPHHDLDHMTTPQEFYQNVVGALEYLDGVLPAGSHVILIGLVDGRILYDSMGERIHPIGSLHNDVTYSAFYDYFNCLGINPCFGWLNSDSWWRNATTQRAMELNQVYQEIVANNTFKNFDMTYYQCPMAAVYPEVVDLWTSTGGQTWQLIEPVDGFHPNQITNVLMTEIMWKKYEQAGLLPPVNPNNPLIAKALIERRQHIKDDDPTDNADNNDDEWDD